MRPVLLPKCLFVAALPFLRELCLHITEMVSHFPCGDPPLCLVFRPVDVHELMRRAREVGLGSACRVVEGLLEPALGTSKPKAPSSVEVSGS